MKVLLFVKITIVFIYAVLCFSVSRGESSISCFFEKYICSKYSKHLGRPDLGPPFSVEECEMANKKAFNELFMDATVKTVAKYGIENTRTKDVAACTGFSEATMYRSFPTKEDLLRETFLHTEHKVSDIFMNSDLIRGTGTASFGEKVHKVWHLIYRYLIEHKEDAAYLIRYRYSSFYTAEVRSKRRAYNGSFDRAYDVFEKHFGYSVYSYRGFLINFVFEMTLCFAEKVVTGRVRDSEEMEVRLWSAISGAITNIIREPQTAEK